MNDNVENLILQQLRDIRSEMGELRSDLSSLRKESEAGFSDITQRVDGVSIILTLLAGHVNHIDERVEAVESKVK